MPSTNKEQKNKTNSEYYHRNKERILAKLKETSAQVYAENKEALLQKSKDHRSKNYEKQLFRSACNRAKRAGLDFNIEESDVVIPEVCPYLGCTLTRTQGQGRVWTNASIDRVDNSQGYVKGNIEIISLKANTMKNHASSDELIAFSKHILTSFWRY